MIRISAKRKKEKKKENLFNFLAYLKHPLGLNSELKQKHTMLNKA